MKQEPIKEVRVGNQILRIFYDDLSDSPREWDNLTKMIFTDKYQKFGDKHTLIFAEHYNSREDFIKKGEIEVKRHFKDVVICKPVYLYGHSGTVGFSVVTKADLQKEHSTKRITKQMIRDADNILDAEVEILNQYITGSIYRFNVVSVIKCSEGHEYEKIEDSCGGLYGNDIYTCGISESIGEELKAAFEAS